MPIITRNKPSYTYNNYRIGVIFHREIIRVFREFENFAKFNNYEIFLEVGACGALLIRVRQLYVSEALTCTSRKNECYLKKIDRDPIQVN